MPWADQFIGIGKESTWGTAVARTEFHRLYPGSFNRHERPSQPYGFLADRDPEGLFFQTEFGDGKLRVPLVFTPISRMLALAMGTDPTKSGPGGDGEYTYVYALPSEPDDSWTAELHMGLPDASLEGWLGDGGKAKNAVYNFAVNEEVILEVDVSLQKVIQAVKTASPTLPDYLTHIVKPSQITVELDDTVTNILNAGITMNPQIKADRGFLGSAYIAEQKNAPGFREISGTLAKEWESKTLYDKFIAGTTAKLEVICTGPIIAGATPYSITFLIPKIQFSGQTPEPGEGGIAEQNLPWRALDDATDGAMKITMVTDEDLTLPLT